MKNFIAIGFVVALAGCSSSSDWVKVDGSEFDADQLAMAKEQCNFTNAKKLSHKLTLAHGLAVGPKSSEPKADDNKAVQSAESAPDNDAPALVKSYAKTTDNKVISQNVVEKANTCMVEKGFTREKFKTTNA